MKTKTFILKNHHILDAAISYLDKLPYDGTLEVVVKKHTKKRSLDQNALYWELISQIAEQARAGGTQYRPEAWHRYCVENVMPDTFIDKNGEIRHKREEIPLFANPLVNISTTELSKESFSEYIEAVTAFAVTELGVRFESNR